MINFLNREYNIKIDKIYKKDNELYFFYDNNKYYIKEYINDEIIKVSNIVSNYYKINTFILNNNKEYKTKYNNKYICLIKVNDIEENTLKLNDIKDFNKITTKNLNNIKIPLYNPRNNFKIEIDNIEELILELNKEYSLIQESINYFIGLAETSVTLLNNEKIIMDRIGINNKVNYKNYLDPYNYIKTDNMYNISNYIKYKFYYEEIDYAELNSILLNNNEHENILLFSYLMYPNNYFKDIKYIINNDIKDYENILNMYINKINSYENLLKYCKKVLKNIKKIQLISWI